MRSWIILASMCLAVLLVITSGFVLLKWNEPSNEPQMPTPSPVAEVQPPTPSTADTSTILPPAPRTLALAASPRDSLQTLFTHLQQQFKADSETIDPHMIPSIRRMVNVANSAEDTAFVVDLFEPSGDLARARASILGSTLRLYGLRTDAIRITGYEGQPTVFVSATQP